MRTEITILRGALRGRAGWISGSLEDRARRGITKAIVHAGSDVEMLSIDSLECADQLALFPDPETKTPPARSPTALMTNLDREISAARATPRSRPRR